MEEQNELISEMNNEPQTEGRSNMDICPNCLEPNPDDLAVCRFCGCPLHPDAEISEADMPEDEETLAANRAAAVQQESRPQKKQESGFRRMVPWLGLYLVFTGITGIFDLKKQIQLAQEEGQQVNVPVAYISQIIWIVAGIMVAWPLIKKGYRKLRHLPDEDEEQTGTTEAAETDIQTEPETTDDAGEGEGSETETDILPEETDAPEEYTEDPGSQSEDEQPYSLLTEADDTEEETHDEPEFEDEDDAEAAKWL